MMISRETDYAVRCVLHLARTPGRIVMIGEIAGACDVPRSFLAKILQRLARAGIVRSYRGAGGGFQLVGDAGQLSLRDVVETMQGPVALNTCAVEKERCSRSGACAVHPVWVHASESLGRTLGTYTFKRLLREENTGE
jgi:Rrf2 family protein